MNASAQVHTLQVAEAQKKPFLVVLPDPLDCPCFDCEGKGTYEYESNGQPATGECFQCKGTGRTTEEKFMARSAYWLINSIDPCPCGPEGCDCADYKESYYAQYE